MTQRQAKGLCSVTTRRSSSPPDSKGQLRRVERGDLVRVDFLAWLMDGPLVDASIYDEPREFIAGEQSVMPGINHLVIGMSIGESRTQLLPPNLAFGPYHTDLCCRVSRSWLKTHQVVPAVGLRLAILKQDRTILHLAVTECEGEQITLDANHSLAGKSIVVQLDLLEILTSSAPAECASGFETTPSKTLMNRGP